MAQLLRFTRGGRVITRRSLVQATAGAAAGAAIIGAPSRTFAAFAQGESLSGKVTQWCYPLAAGGDQAANEELWAGLVTGFNAENPDVEVAVEVLPWADRNTKLTTALAAGAGPDVGYLNADFVPQHAGDGNLEPVDDVIADDVDDFSENSRTNLTLRRPALRGADPGISHHIALQHRHASNRPGSPSTRPPGTSCLPRVRRSRSPGTS